MPQMGQTHCWIGKCIPSGGKSISCKTFRGLQPQTFLMQDQKTKSKCMRLSHHLTAGEWQTASVLLVWVVLESADVIGKFLIAVLALGCLQEKRESAMPVTRPASVETPGRQEFAVARCGDHLAASGWAYICRLLEACCRAWSNQRHTPPPRLFW